MKRGSISILTILVLMCLSPWAQASIQHFSNSMENSSWSVDAKTDSCALVQQITRLGQAKFREAPGQELSFDLDVVVPPREAGMALFQSLPPVWRHETARKSLGEVPLLRGTRALHLGYQLSRRIFFELEGGMNPHMYYQDWADGQDYVVVALSAIGFRQAKAEFEGCVAKLPAPKSKIEKDYFVYFATDSAELTQDSLKLLRQLSEKRAESGALKFAIDAHADRRGTDQYNQSLSQRRADTVGGYLLSCGVPSAQIVAEYFGEAQPTNSADSVDAWRENRRVRVRVLGDIK